VYQGAVFSGFHGSQVKLEGKWGFPQANGPIWQEAFEFILDPADESETLYEGGNRVHGYYEQNGTRFNMEIDLFSLMHGAITGSGKDTIGDFNITGKYSTTTLEFEFCKQYIGKHLIEYKGMISKTPVLTLSGFWYYNWQKGEGFQFILN